METFDAIVIGAGSGLNISSSLADKGKSVAVIEKGPMGGTCLNRGCIPSKILIHSADLMQEFVRAKDFGLSMPTRSKVDFAKITSRASRIVDKDAKNIEQGILETKGITLFKAQARFTGHKTLQAGQKKITAQKIFILAGARPTIPAIPGLSEVPYITSTQALRLTKQPKSMIVIGGGYIAAELAHFYGSLGTKITIIQRSDRLLKNEDMEVSKKFTELFSKQHTVLTSTSPSSVSHKAGSFFVSLGKRILKAGALLVATGVTPNSDILEVEKSKIKTTKAGFIETDDYLETSVSGIWAAGDIAGKYLFKHSANLEAAYALHNSQNPKNKLPVDYTAMPHAVFTNPQIAATGYTEQKLKEDNISYVSGKHYYKQTGMGEALQEHDGFVKFLASPKGKILGCHILGPHASTLIHEVLVAMKFAGADLKAIANTIHIHPALSEVVQRAASDTLSKI